MSDSIQTTTAQVDLSTQYLGLDLKNPLVCSSSPLMENIDNIRQMEDAGASAVILHSLFEEQITLESHDLDHHLFHGTESHAEAMSYFPEMSGFGLGPERYLTHITAAKKAVDIPVIASLNCVSSGSWLEWATFAEEAGADALELNTYFLSTDAAVPGGRVEDMYATLIADVKQRVSIPVAMKLSPFFSSIPNVCQRLSDAGADGLVLFNRFYQPDFDLERLEVTPALTLSDPSTLLMRLHWVAIVYGHVSADLAVTGGVHDETGVLKSMMAGAKVAMMTSALLRHGVDHLTEVETRLRQWMVDHDYESIEMMQGSMSHRSVAEPAAFERANYMKVLRAGALTWGR
ncbi:MAG: dihydroorotate dehydrogenase-like protein [Myxococcales bacterium]|nr:dihydroorotate dehydrogenase-like protein [Myxococcales bacterium]